MSHAWVPVVPLMADELLSSWLARVALVHGCDPLTLTGSLWQDWRPWTCDLDRGLRRQHAETLAQRSGVDLDAIERASLREVAQLTNHPTRLHVGVWPWIVALGVRNRMRYAGLPYCARCLEQDDSPYFRRSWRLAWHVGCDHHGTLLLDSCPRCHEPVQPHRCRAADATLACCTGCGCDLRSTEHPPVDPVAMAFQQVADTVLAEGCGSWRGVRLDRLDWFEHARAHCGRREGGQSSSAEPIAALGLSLELEPPMQRQCRLRLAWAELNKPDQTMLNAIHAGAPHVAHRPPGSVRDAKHVRTRAPAKPRPPVQVRSAWLRLKRRLRIHA